MYTLIIILFANGTLEDIPGFTSETAYLAAREVILQEIGATNSTGRRVEGICVRM